MQKHITLIILILYKRDLVERENCFSVKDYNPLNFIVEDDTLDLYYVDLTDGVSADCTDHTERMNDFYERFLVDKERDYSY